MTMTNHRPTFHPHQPLLSMNSQAKLGLSVRYYIHISSVRSSAGDVTHGERGADGHNAGAGLKGVLGGKVRGCVPGCDALGKSVHGVQGITSRGGSAAQRSHDAVGAGVGDAEAEAAPKLDDRAVTRPFEPLARTRCTPGPESAAACVCGDGWGLAAFDVSVPCGCSGARTIARAARCGAEMSKQICSRPAPPEFAHARVLMRTLA